MGAVAETIVPSGKLMLQYAEQLLKDVTPDKFARMPQGVTTNHPAFVLGHLALYPHRVATALNHPDAITPPADPYAELFAASATCRDDPDNAIYPPMDDVVDAFMSSHRVLLQIVAETHDDVFARTNPNDNMRDRFPTIGSMTDFMVGGHAMMHLGQVSAWRRTMGLGPCF